MFITGKMTQYRIGMKDNEKRTVFICQAGESSLKLVKFGSRGECLGVEVESLSVALKPKQAVDKVILLFNKLKYNKEPVILSLPRSSVTCRYLKVPAAGEAQIEKIVSLQASRYLPYPAGEIICGYQVISTDSEGYSQICIVVAHKQVIEDYMPLFGALKCRSFSVIVSSFGLYNVYKSIGKTINDPVLLMDIDSSQIELAIVSNTGMLFSRAFKLNRVALTNWQDILVQEINMTLDAYVKESFLKTISKVIVLAQGGIGKEFSEVLRSRARFEVEELPYVKNIMCSADISSRLSSSEYSFASLLGMGLSRLPESLSLVPDTVKQTNKNALLFRQYSQIALLITAIILFICAAIFNNLNLKAVHLNGLKSELNLISKEGMSLENLAKRLNTKRKKLSEVSCVEILSGLYRAIPEEITLTSFTYNQNKELILSGQTKELNSVFGLVSKMEGSEEFKKFNIKVRYATQRRLRETEVVDFEIIGLKK